MKTMMILVELSGNFDDSMKIRKRKISMLLLLLVTTLNFSVLPLQAAKIRKTNIVAAQRDPKYDEKCAHLMEETIMAQLRAGEFYSVDFNQPMSNFEIAKSLKPETKNISISNGADNHLLDDASIFQNVESVSLKSERFNSTYLRALSSKMPNLDSLSISQTEALNENDLESLKKFEHLKHLALWCPVSSNRTIPIVLPISLTFLQIDGSLPNASLPNLEELRISHCYIDSAFWNQLDAPLTERIYFDQVDLAPNTFKNMGQRKSLRDLYFYNSNINPIDLETVRSFEFVSLQSQMCAKQIKSAWKTAEKSFKKGNFMEAANDYIESVFSIPTEYGYLQLARCYFELNNLTAAADYFERAANVGPPSSNVRERTAKLGKMRRNLR